MSIDFEAFNAVHAAWTAGGWHSSASKWASAMDQMRAVQKSIGARGDWSAGPSALMEVLGVQRNEVALCRVARWLFDPLSRHRLGAHMLTEFAQRIGLDGFDATAAVVDAEVSRAETRADLVISSLDGTTIVVEAKVDASESLGQGRRLEQDWPEAAALVFLTVPGNTLPATALDTGRWVAISWRWLAETALTVTDRTVDGDQSADEARATAVAWAHMIRRIFQ